MTKKLTLADFPDEPYLNSSDLALRQSQLDAKEASETPVVETPAPAVETPPATTSTEPAK